MKQYFKASLLKNLAEYHIDYSTGDAYDDERYIYHVCRVVGDINVFYMYTYEELMDCLLRYPESRVNIRLYSGSRNNFDGTDIIESIISFRVFNKYGIYINMNQFNVNIPMEIR